MFKSLFEIKPGANCDELIDNCVLSNPCGSFSTEINVNYTCINYTPQQQMATNLTYYCNGTCPNPTGFLKSPNGFCSGAYIIISLICSFRVKTIFSLIFIFSVKNENDNIKISLKYLTN